MGSEEEQDWYFTWGANQKHPNHFTKIFGTYGEARDMMNAIHGHAWAFQYPNAEAAGVERHGLKEIY